MKLDFVERYQKNCQNIVNYGDESTESLDEISETNFSGITNLEIMRRESM
jgi:hypothetical protein